MAGDTTRRIQFLRERGVLGKRASDRRGLSTQDIFRMAEENGFSDKIQGQGKQGETASAQNRVVTRSVQDGQKVETLTSVPSEKTVEPKPAERSSPTPPASNTAEAQFKPQDPNGRYVNIDNLKYSGYSQNTEDVQSRRSRKSNRRNNIVLRNSENNQISKEGLRRNGAKTSKTLGPGNLEGAKTFVSNTGTRTTFTENRLGNAGDVIRSAREQGLSLSEIDPKSLENFKVTESTPISPTLNFPPPAQDPLSSKEYIKETIGYVGEFFNKIVRGYGKIQNAVSDEIYPDRKKGATFLDGVPGLKNISSEINKKNEVDNKGLLFDTDVQAAGTVAALYGVGQLPVVGPFATKTAITSFVGLQAGKTVANPTPENVGDTIGFGLAIAAPKIVEVTSPQISRASTFISNKVSEVKTSIRVGEAQVRQFNSAKNNPVGFSRTTELQKISKDLSLDVKVQSPERFDIVQFTEAGTGGQKSVDTSLTISLGKPTTLNNKPPANAVRFVGEGSETTFTALELPSTLASQPAKGVSATGTLKGRVDRTIKVETFENILSNSDTFGSDVFNVKLSQGSEVAPNSILSTINQRASGIITGARTSGKTGVSSSPTSGSTPPARTDVPFFRLEQSVTVPDVVKTKPLQLADTSPPFVSFVEFVEPNIQTASFFKPKPVTVEIPTIIPDTGKVDKKGFGVIPSSLFQKRKTQNNQKQTQEFMTENGQVLIRETVKESSKLSKLSSEQNLSNKQKQKQFQSQEQTSSSQSKSQVQSQISIQEQRVIQVQRTRQRTKSSTKTSAAFINGQAQAQSLKQSQVQSLKQSQDSAQLQKQSTDQLQKQTTDQTQETTQQLIKQSTPINDLIGEFPRGPTTRITRTTTSTTPKIPVRFTDPNRKKKSSGFDVLVRRRGKFKRVNTEPLTRSSAEGLGQRIVSGSAAATFKLIRTSSFGKDLGRGPSNLQKFKKKKTKTGIEFIEPNRSRINTAGELSQITFSAKNRNGIRTTRRK